MKICIPVKSDAGLDSPVNADFDSTSLYLVCDGSDMSYEVIDDRNSAGDGNILKGLINDGLEAIITYTMKPAAFVVLKRRTGLQIYRASQASAGENIRALLDGKLPELAEEDLIELSGCGGSCGSCNVDCSSKK
tara:strand:+ start:309 stop:710 length:402 start_codon:yes stop_codon:yes gene_type:complete